MIPIKLKYYFLSISLHYFLFKIMLKIQKYIKNNYTNIIFKKLSK